MRHALFPQRLNFFLQLVEPTASRWHTLVIWTHDCIAMMQALDRVMRLSVPQLRLFRLIQEKCSMQSDPTVRGDLFQSFLSGARSLILVQFYLVHLPWIAFSASNLQRIEIAGLSGHTAMNYDQLRQVLTASHRLMQLKFTNIFPHVDDHTIYPPIVLPALEYLNIGSSHPIDSDLSIFHLLSTPVLKTLEITQFENLNVFISRVNITPPKYALVTSLILNSIYTCRSDNEGSKKQPFGGRSPPQGPMK
jgi:hypothetical protein